MSFKPHHPSNQTILKIRNKIRPETAKQPLAEDELFVFEQWLIDEIVESSFNPDRNPTPKSPFNQKIILHVHITYISSCMIEHRFDPKYYQLEYLPVCSGISDRLFRCWTVPSSIPKATNAVKNPMKRIITHRQTSAWPLALFLVASLLDTTW